MKGYMGAFVTEVCFLCRPSSHFADSDGFRWDHTPVFLPFLFNRTIVKNVHFSLFVLTYLCQKSCYIYEHYYIVPEKNMKLGLLFCHLQLI